MPMPPHHSMLFSTMLNQPHEDGSNTVDVMSPLLKLKPDPYWGEELVRPLSREYPYATSASGMYRPGSAAPLSDIGPHHQHQHHHQHPSSAMRMSHSRLGPPTPSPMPAFHAQLHRDHSASPISPAPTPTLDLSGLIPMYPEPPSPHLGSRVGHLTDISYDQDAWATPAGLPSAHAHGHYAPPPSYRQKPTLWSADPVQHQHQHQHSHSHMGGWSGPSSAASMGSQFGAYDAYSPSSPYSSSASSGASSPGGSYLLPRLPSPPESKPYPLPSPILPHRSAQTLVGAATPVATSAGAMPGSSSSSNPSPNPNPKKSCFHCHATSTPLWRREPSTQRTLCNACGLYLQQRNKLRPQELIDADRDTDEDDELAKIPDAEYTGPKCSHCGTRRTSVWRRNKEGAQVCNACGVYARLRGKERPLSLKRNKIKPRTKHTHNTQSR
ncbi:unnamed protein product [Mycena citricolor]|uniref:GATA-type domain-containing protein n=1 Tax=Mycena citricolor TaxID=2018698 RepID=A0AAD2JZT5_9AGAR|nr:unnamed protein product [Mycena citricolor]